MEGISIGGQNVNKIKFTDDNAVLIVDSIDKFQRIIERANAASEDIELKIKKSETQCKVISKGSAPTCSITIGNEPIKEVGKFKYLGITLPDDGRCESEIKQGNWTARSAFTNEKSHLQQTHQSSNED